jgi:hypothetical protein
MPAYTYIVVDTTTGDSLEEVTLSDVSYTMGLNGAGSFSGSMALSDPKCRRSLLKTLAREILVLREGVPVFNGPILGLTASGSKLQITAGPVWWYMQNRTLELGRDYVAQDMSAIFDNIMSTVNGKFLGDIRLDKASPYNSTGQLHTVSYDAITRKLASEAISELSQIYPGFDWMVNLRIDPTTGKTLREYQVYPGFKGVLVDQSLTFQNTIDFVDTDDGTRAFNRVHELGAGQDNTQLIVSRSAYEPDAYFDYGEYDTGWTTGGDTAVDQGVGRPAPSFRLAAGGNMSRNYSHGVGSKIEFDYYHTGVGTNLVGSETGALNDSGNFHFGCDSSGNGMAFGSYISASGVEGCGLVRTPSWGTTASTSTNKVSNMKLRSKAWYRVLVDIRSTTVAHVYVNSQQIQYWNGSIYVYDFPITLMGTHVGMSATGDPALYGYHHFDNLIVPQATSTYTNPGIPYIERVMSRTDVTDLKSLQFYAQADIFLGSWPSRTYTVKYRPSVALPFNFCTPGDTVPLDFEDGYFDVVGTKRVVSIPVTVDNTGGEVVELVFNDTHI